MSGNTYRQIPKSETITEQSELKAELTLINSLIKICDERMQELRNEDGRINYNFRVNARIMLKSETYKKYWKYLITREVTLSNAKMN
jgi:predicted nuclease with TOPRIM domain